MTLQFKPQMYLDRTASRPATTSSCSTRSRSSGREARDQEPRLQRPHPGPRRRRSSTWSRSACPPRRSGRRSIGFSRAYVPYAQILAREPVTRHRRQHLRVEPVGQDDHRRSRARRPSSSCRRCSRRRSRRRSRPERRVPRRSRRAARTASWSRTTCSRSSSKSNPGKVKQVAFTKPLNVRVRLLRRAEGQHHARQVPEQVHLQCAEQRSAGEDLQGDHRGPAAPDASLQEVARAKRPDGSGRQPRLPATPCAHASV